MWTYLSKDKCPDWNDDTSRSGVLTTISNGVVSVRRSNQGAEEERTNFVLHTFVRKGSRRRLAEKNNAPLSTLRELQAFVINLVCQLSCWSQNNRTDAFPCIRRGA